MPTTDFRETSSPTKEAGSSDDSSALMHRSRRGVFAKSEKSLATQRLENGTPLEAARVIPSNAPMPLAAQRDFRGWIVVAIVVLIFVGIALSVTLVAKVSGRTVYYAPTAERIGAATASREATDFEAQTQAQMLVARMETYSPASAERVWESMLPFLHPSLHQKVKSDYVDIARKAQSLWQHRVAIPLGAALGGRNAGIITVAVFYDSVELTGREEFNRTLNRTVEKAAYIEFAMDVPSKENPIGIVMTRYLPLEKQDWIARGFPAMWSQFRTVPVPK